MPTHTTARGLPIVNEISMSRHAIGVRLMPDRLDSGKCHLCSSDAEVRVCTGGVYTSLCGDHRTALADFLRNPLPSPLKKEP